MPRGDLQNPAAIYVKGFAFALIALIAIGGLLIEHLSLRFGLMLSIAIWASCRFYYFAFYVIEKYVDPSYRFAGLIDFARYLIGKPRQ